MKKSLLALAALTAFAGVASAQSSVTIYGLIDMGITKGNGGTAANAGANGASKAWTMKEASGSRLGFNVREDLGGGMAAGVHFEHRFTADDGAANATFWNGRSYVHLGSAGAGQVYLGREYAPAFWPAVKSDPFGFDGVGQLGAKMWAGYLTNSGVRTSNTFGYKSPNMGGFTVNVAVAAGEGTLSRNTGFNAEYAAGPMYFGFGYDKSDGGLADGNSLWNLAAHYNMGFATLIGYYASAEVANNDRKYFSLAARVPVGSGMIKLAYGRLNPDGANNNESKFGIGYNHFLSKRTNFYVDLGQGRQDTRSNNTAYAVGLKHTF